MAYATRTPAADAAIAAIRAAVRDRKGIATTAGYGPRFLHSTGQLHKGGADNFVGIQFTAEVAQDEPVPGESFTFGQLIAAQALGDFQSLRSRHRRALRVELSAKPEADLAKVAKLL